MRHQKRVAKLGRTASHRKALMMNLATALIQHGKIKTTDAKAKELRRVIERLITFGKKGTVHHRRLAFRVLHDRSVVKILFEHIAPQYADRQGGYTRIVKLGFRDNDCAAVSLIEFVDYKHPGEGKKASKTVKKSIDDKKDKSVKEEPKQPELKKTKTPKKEAKTEEAVKEEPVPDTDEKQAEKPAE